MTPARRAATLRFILDVICVVIFVIVGRRNPNETTDAVGTVRTAAPFLIALLGAWVGAKAWRSPRTLSTGVVLWIVTTGVGLGIRRFVFGDGIATPFVIVTTLVLGLLLVGTRLQKRPTRPSR
jgi:NADH:ubiquinone oxidoreductase subunit 4 (subunit M)